MADELKTDPKDNRDFLVEAVKIAEGRTSIQPRVEHVKVLYKAWMEQMQKGESIRSAISNIAKAAREGKLKPGQPIPGVPFMTIKQGAPGDTK